MALKRIDPAELTRVEDLEAWALVLRWSIAGRGFKLEPKRSIVAQVKEFVRTDEAARVDYQRLVKKQRKARIILGVDPARAAS